MCLYVHLLLFELLHKDLQVSDNITSEAIKLEGMRDNF